MLILTRGIANVVRAGVRAASTLGKVGRTAVQLLRAVDEALKALRLAAQSAGKWLAKQFATLFERILEALEESRKLLAMLAAKVDEVLPGAVVRPAAPGGPPMPPMVFMSAEEAGKKGLSTGGVKAGQEAVTPLQPAKVHPSNLSEKELKKLARTDKAAAEALVDKYWQKSDAELRRLAAKDDQTAHAVLRQRTSPNDEALARALGSDYRPPHSAEITIRRDAGEVFRGKINSGNMTSQEAALGYPRSSLATHTEARAVRRPDLQSGDVMTIMGQYDPCSACRTAMRTAAQERSITIHYRWMGGSETFHP
jgi:hypothetical protein